MSQELGDNANKFCARSLDEAEVWNNKGVALLAALEAVFGGQPLYSQFA